MTCLLRLVVCLKPQTIEVINAEKRAGVPIVQPFLGQVPKRLLKNNWLRHAGNHAEGKDLVGVDLQALSD